MKAKFQADADLNQEIIRALTRREPGVDFRTAHSAGLAGLSDPQVLEVAARDGRILVTSDRRTMPRHFAEFIKANVSPGLVIVSQNVSAATAAEELLLIWLATEHEEWVDRICTIP